MKVIKPIFLSYNLGVTNSTASVYVNFDVKFINIKAAVYTTASTSGNYYIVSSDMVENQPMAMFLSQLASSSFFDQITQNILIEFFTPKKIQGLYNFSIVNTTNSAPSPSATDRGMLICEFYDENSYPPRVTCKNKIPHELGSFRSCKISKTILLSFTASTYSSTSEVHIPFYVKFISVKAIAYIAASATTKYAVINSDMTDFQELGITQLDNKDYNPTMNIDIELNVAKKISGLYTFYLKNTSNVAMAGTGSTDTCILLLEFYDDSASPILIRTEPLKLTDIPGKIDI